MAAEKSNGRPMTKSTEEKRDDDIMMTNDSSIISKRSVVQLYHKDQPDFFRPFVAKAQRRSPLINRGYWLRMRAIEHTVKQFLEEPSEKEKVVVNLGCGYDPLPFHFLHEFSGHVLRRHSSTWIIRNSCARSELVLRKTTSSKSYFHSWLLQPPQAPISGMPGNTLPWAVISANFRGLRASWKKKSRSNDRAVLFVAEVSIAYMDVKSADSVISWASSFNDSRFCILEQCLPDGPDHPFASTMLGHFEKLHTHLKVVYRYPTQEAQRQRFIDAGWPHVKVQSLWSLWTDEAYLNSEDRQALDSVEPFDEWEEFALFAGHYLLLVARTKDAGSTESVTNRVQNGHQHDHAEAKAKISLPYPSDAQELGFRRFGAMFPAGKCIYYHGGYGSRQRLSDCDVYTKTGISVGPEQLSVELPLMCHTITNVNDEYSLLVGGRTSPNKVKSECWLLKDTCEQVTSIPTPRYRHCAVSTSIWVDGKPGHSRNGVLVFGGKSEKGIVLNDWWFWTLERGWEPVHTVHADGERPVLLPATRFGGSMCTSYAGSSGGVLTGGMSADGTVLNDLWEWELRWKNGGAEVACFDRTSDIDRSNGLGRFGANLLRCEVFGRNSPPSYLIIGGVAKDRVLKWEEEALLITPTRHGSISRVELPFPAGPRPLLIGMGAVNTDDRHMLLAGGGAVCFSMGSYWNAGGFLLEITAKDFPPLRLKEKSASPAVSEIKRIRMETQEDFETLVANADPAIIEGLDLGPCTRLWTPAYLRERIGEDRSVIVHSSPAERMTFQTKNFSYIKQSFGEFIDAVTSGSKLYLRSVASTQPAKRATKLSEDFPGIAGDFALPETLAPVAKRLHSSPLRISGPVTLWLHYDVLANVLCQVRGTKRLRLYPPGDVAYLSYGPGASSSNIDVYAPADALSPEQRARLERTHPHEAFLRPGDVLFIPPAWSHTARPEEGVSVAVNCFWRNLDEGVYAAGRDVYGNRDLAAYEDGRKALAKLAKGLEGVPADLRAFYLERLAGELRSR